MLNYNTRTDILTAFWRPVRWLDDTLPHQYKDYRRELAERLLDPHIHKVQAARGPILDRHREHPTIRDGLLLCVVELLLDLHEDATLLPGIEDYYGDMQTALDDVAGTLIQAIKEIPKMPLKAEDYAFTVTTEKPAAEWDVYRVNVRGMKGMMAYRKTETGQFEIGFMRAGEFTEAEVGQGITEGFS